MNNRPTLRPDPLIESVGITCNFSCVLSRHVLQPPLLHRITTFGKTRIPCVPLLPVLAHNTLATPHFAVPLSSLLSTSKQESKLLYQLIVFFAPKLNTLIRTNTDGRWTSNARVRRYYSEVSGCQLLTSRRCAAPCVVSASSVTFIPGGRGC